MAENGNGSLAMSPTIKELSVALIAVQRELPKVEKDKVNPFFRSKYVGLDTVMPVILEALTNHGLGLIQTIGSDANGGSALSTMLVHESGEWIKDTQPLLLHTGDEEGKGATLNPQGQGSAVTYARRYGAMSILGLVADEDDDANAASNPPTPRRAPRAPTRPKAGAAPPATPASREVPAEAQRAHEETQGVPPPAAQPRAETGEVATDRQKTAIHSATSVAFDTPKAMVEWMQGVCPEAIVEGELHTTGLTKTQASNILDAINKYRAERQ